MDSGNEWRTVISETLRHKLKLTTTPFRGPQNIGTAKAGTTLKILGVLAQPIHFHFRDNPNAGIFSILPLVLQGLAMDINISGPFMQHHGIIQNHQQGCLQIGHHNIPLAISASSAIRRVYVRETTIIPPQSIATVAATIGGPESSTTWEVQTKSLSDDWGLLLEERPILTKGASRTISAINPSNQPLVL